MLRLTVGTLATATPIVMGAHVYAADGDSGETKPSRRMKIAELPIYGEPPVREFEFVAFEETVLMKPPYDVITVCRQSVAQVYQGAKEQTDKVFGKFTQKVPHVTDFVRYVQEESNVIVKAGIITGAGLAGVALGSVGYKGGLTRRMLFSFYGLTTASVLCYPKQAVDIAKTQWNNLSGPHHWSPSESSHAVEASNAEEAPEEATSAETTLSKVDHGMSKAEDKDMYTTRE